MLQTVGEERLAFLIILAMLQLQNTLIECSGQHSANAEVNTQYLTITLDSGPKKLTLRASNAT